MLESIGYICALGMGVTLGIFGGGGSILTVPILVYLMNVSPVQSTLYSLFIVGITSAIGAISFIRKKEVHFGIGLIFATPAFLGVFLARRFILPAVPPVVFQNQFLTIDKSSFIMIFFSLVMLIAALSMIRGKKASLNHPDEIAKISNYPLVALEGLLVGMLTGFVGAGGGFLIIPALVLLAKLPMKTAVGTSLFIIAIKSTFGVLGDIQTFHQIDWHLLIRFTLISIVGITGGSIGCKYIPSQQLKPLFGWFVLVMGSIVLFKNIAG